MRSIKEQVKVDHVARHVIGPFENLWSDVDQECSRGPTSKDPIFCRGVVHEEERHCGFGCGPRMHPFRKLGENLRIGSELNLL